MLKINDKIVIKSMKGESNYNGRSGYVTHIDDAGQIHGTWGGLALIADEDEFEIIQERNEDETSDRDWNNWI